MPNPKLHISRVNAAPEAPSQLKEDLSKILGRNSLPFGACFCSWSYISVPYRSREGNMKLKRGGMIYFPLHMTRDQEAFKKKSWIQTQSHWITKLSRFLSYLTALEVLCREHNHIIHAHLGNRCTPSSLCLHDLHTSNPTKIYECMCIRYGIPTPTGEFL